ncbi:MAG: SPOR domain-containing protein [Magnetovibrio sp.]|nr:SPOR domain-containing protein [Magnetovibrio sp.]
MNNSPEQIEDNTPDASELLDFELIAKSQPEKGRGLWLWVVLIVILSGGGGAGWMYLQAHSNDFEQANAGGVPLILAPQFSLKEKPADPGGMKVPDRDKSVYNRMIGSAEIPTSGTIERLLPPAEAPLSPPKVVAKMAVPATSVVVPIPARVVPKPENIIAPVQSIAPPPPPVVAKIAKKAEPVAKPAPVASKIVASRLGASRLGASRLGKVLSSAPAGLGYLVQLSAVRTEQAAKGEWKRLAGKHVDILGGLDMVIQRADLGTKGIFYRVRGGWLAKRGEAKAVCAELARRNVGCIIVKP